VNNNQIKLLTSLTVVVAALALAGSALAGTRPDDRAGFRGAGLASSPIQVRPDDRAGVRGVGIAGLAGPLRPDDRAGIRGTGGTNYAAPLAGPWYTPAERKWLAAYSKASFEQKKAMLAGSTVADVSEAGDFQWIDAGLGAGALGMMLLAGGLTVWLARMRSQRRWLGHS